MCGEEGTGGVGACGTPLGLDTSTVGLRSCLRREGEEILVDVELAVLVGCGANAWRRDPYGSVCCMTRSRNGLQKYKA